MRQIVSASASDDLVRITRGPSNGAVIEYRLIGQLAAIYRPDLVEPVSGQSDIVVSARPDFIYHRDPSSQGIRMTASSEPLINFTSALAAVTLREDGYGVIASGLLWNVRLALSWTRVRILNRGLQDPYLDLAFQWRFHEHPSPMRLLQWTKDWGNIVQNLHAQAEQRVDRIVYAWIYYQLLWLGAAMYGVPDPFDLSFNTDDSWDSLLAPEPTTGRVEERVRWKTRTLPLLARPEIGLDKKVQQRLLKFVKDSTNQELPLYLREQRRRLITDAILAAADEAALPTKDAEDLVQVDRAIEVFERRHRDIQGDDSPWWKVVEERAQANQSPGSESNSSEP